MSQTHIPAELRRLVRERARYCCEYCLFPEAFSLLTHGIDHIAAEKHRGETVESNLCLACLICNKYKGTDLTSIDPATGEIEPLFHPRRHAWREHFRFAGGRIDPLTPTGRVTVQLLQLNQPQRIAERLILLELGAIGAAS
jgi:5-methylcytosine-specific restriction endonuclease McrA